jgi:hypothetical protein
MKAILWVVPGLQAVSAAAGDAPTNEAAVSPIRAKAAVTHERLIMIFLPGFLRASLLRDVRGNANYS